MDNQNEPEQLHDGAVDHSEHDELSTKHCLEIAEHLSKPVVVPLHVLLILSNFASVAADAADESEALYDALADAGLASMEPASDKDKEDLGEECPEEFPTVSRDVYNSINWATTVLQSQGLTGSPRAGEDDDEDDDD